MKDNNPPPPHSQRISGFEKLNHEELLARGMMSDAFSGTIQDWQAPDPEMLESLLSGYQVKSLLGRGGMGAVYRVFQPDLERECALKLLPLEVSLASGFEQRFLQEARAMAKLDHPNIVTIYDFGRTSEGHLYYVMECVEGMDLSALIKDNSLDLPDALDVVSQVCEALDYAHSAGYVHRDIKPANILINTKGMVKVTDFGLAKLLNQDTPDYGMTMTGQVMGTPDYMAPEQAHGQKVDQRADIYALGVLLYEMLTGSLPKGVFSPPSQKVAVDVRLDEVVIRALQQEPEKRYQQASDIKTSIDQIRQDSTKLNAETSQNLVPEHTSEPPPNTPEKSTKTESSYPKWMIPIATVLGLLMIGGFAWYSLSSSNNTEAKKPVNTNHKTPPLDTSLWPVQDEKHTNSLGIPFVPVSGTDVIFSVWETRRKDWDKFLRETDHQWERPSFNGLGDHPVPNISWHDANAYCKWLTKKERASGNIGPNMEYRLPTDMEWSAAVGLGREEGKDPEARSGKVKDLYPWGKVWPAPEGVNEAIDNSSAVVLAQDIQYLASLYSSKADSDTFQSHVSYAWAKIRPLVDGAVYDYYDSDTSVSKLLKFKTSSIIHFKNKTYLVSKSKHWKSVYDKAIRVADWEQADWTNEEFITFVRNGGLGDHKNLTLWTNIIWNGTEWQQGEKTYPYSYFQIKNHDVLGKKAPLIVIWSEKKLQFSAVLPPSNMADTVVQFNGILSKDDILQEIDKALKKWEKHWNSEAIILIDKLLPKYENDWQQKIRPVDQLWENPFGIKGLAGSQREWVRDPYNSQNKRTLRGGALRSDARGPQLNALPTGNEKLETFCQGVVPVKTAFLSSHRGHAQPATRNPWNGFRPVLAFTK